jgi:hypothetical protein
MSRITELSQIASVITVDEDNNKNVGIGTTTAQYKLDIYGDINFSGNLRKNGVVYSFGNETQWEPEATGIHTLSNVGIGTTNARYTLEVGSVGTSGTSLWINGDASITGIILGQSLNLSGICTATDFNATSDINLKTNINNISDSLEKISQINGVTFNWKETNKPSAGVIAQEIEKILPQLVNNNGENKSVNYNGLIGLLIEAVKELSREIDKLKK